MAATKKQKEAAERFNTEVRNIILEEGGSVRVDPQKWILYDMVIDTEYGPLLLTPSTDPEEIAHGRSPRSKSSFTVFGLFEDPEKARQAAPLLGSNPFSGKYNLHLSGGSAATLEEDIRSALRSFRMYLQRARVE